MRKATRFSGRNASVLAILLGTVAVSGCTEGEGLGFLQSKPKLEGEARAETTTRLVERDVEAPDVFSAAEAGLWDGRPSLGGVWVAHPDVNDPERVIIRNSANGKFVIGALFRKEREIPGPRLQASSDAAQALGMLAGSPVQLEVTALRREEVAPEPEVAAAEPTIDVAEAPTPAPTVSAPGAVRQASLAPIAGAAAAIDASEPANAAPAAEAETEMVAAVAAPEASAETASAPRKPWFGAKLFQKKPKAVGAPLSALSDTPAAIPASAPVTESALPPAQAASAQPATAKPAAAAAPKTSSLDKPFLQIGIFSVQGNAQNTANQMRSAGIVPTVYEQSSNGKPFWRVVVGPAQTSSERSALLKKIQGIGYSDAYAVTN